MAHPSDRLQQVYEKRAALEYSVPIPLPDPRVDREYERIIALTAGTLPADSLLDAGCGDGRYLAGVTRLPNRPSRLAGCDISERILQTSAQ